LIARTERSIALRKRWSIRRERASQLRQNCLVVETRASASSTSTGEAKSSAHERAQYARPPAASMCRARTRLPSINESSSLKATSRGAGARPRMPTAAMTSTAATPMRTSPSLRDEPAPRNTLCSRGTPTRTSRTRAHGGSGESAGSPEQA
jgi:hypothetical protein